MDEVVIDIRADAEVLRQLITIGEWMKARNATPRPGRVSWEEAVLFCIETCFESVGNV